MTIIRNNSDCFPLNGNRKELWAIIDVSENWRIVFRFEEGNVYVVDYEDYH